MIFMLLLGSKITLVPLPGCVKKRLILKPMTDGLRLCKKVFKGSTFHKFFKRIHKMGMVSIAVLKCSMGNFFLLGVYLFDGVAQPVNVSEFSHGHSRNFFEVFLHRPY